MMHRSLLLGLAPLSHIAGSYSLIASAPNPSPLFNSLILCHLSSAGIAIVLHGKYGVQLDEGPP